VTAVSIRHRNRRAPLLTWVLLSMLVAACSGHEPSPPPPASPQSESPVAAAIDGPPQAAVDLTGVPDAVPRMEPRSSLGNPPFYEVDGQRYYVAQHSHGYQERGVASWYGTKFHGRRTSSGEPYDMYAMTAAHKTLPLPTYAEVVNLENGRRAVVRVNDRGPFKDNRVIDLSYAAAQRLDIVGPGTGLVEIRALDPLGSDERAGSSLPTPRGPPELYLQVGAFRDRANAFSLRDRLQGTLVPRIRIETVTQVTGVVYRVQVGPLDSVAEADRMVRVLRNLGVEKYHIAFDWPLAAADEATMPLGRSQRTSMPR